MKNEIEVLDVSTTPGIARAMSVKWSSRAYPGQPTAEPTREFDLQTHGILQLEMADGTVLVISTSEWCTVEYFAPPGLRK